jgi:hypothetical protein
MGVKVKNVGDKGQAVRTLPDQAKGICVMPFDARLIGLQVWNPADDDSAIWQDPNSFYAYGIFSPATAVLTAWVVDDQTGNILFQTAQFLAPPFPPGVPPGANGANWACLCSGLARGQPGTFFIQARNGSQLETISAHFTAVH